MDTVQNQAPTPSLNTPPKKNNILYWLLFIFAGIEGLPSLIFIIFVMPQVTVLTESLDGKTNILPTVYLGIIFFLCIMQIAYGFWLKHIQKQRVLKEMETIMAFMILGGSFFLFSWLIGNTIISVISPLYQLTSPIQ